MLGLGTLGVIGISVRTKGVGSKGHYENSFIRGPIFTKPFEGSRKTKNEFLKMTWSELNVGMETKPSLPNL